MRMSLQALLATDWTPVLCVGHIWWCGECGAGGWRGGRIWHRRGCLCR